VAIVGLGLIGGSIALGIRERWPAIRVIGVDRSAVLAHAAGSGAIDRGVTDIGDLDAPDLVVLSAPVQDNLRLLGHAARLGASTVITDVGGTKRVIVQASSQLGPSGPVFIGGHPIGGAEHGGFAFARPDLFRRRPWIFTPEGTVPAECLERVFAFAAGLGAKPTTMTAAEHDRLMAFLSHLPQLTASVLMEIVGEAVSTEGLRLAGRGLMDTTRLASSPAHIWQDICASNGDQIGAALDLLIARLTDLRRGLDRGEFVEALFDAAARWRGELTKGGD
jgi:prephenate dehydrogenase